MKQSQESKLVIGLTGGIASGKSTVAEYFSNFGITIISADAIAKNLMHPNSPTLNKIAKTFGASILTKEFELDRSKLREIIFNDEHARKQLNAITHPAIRKETRKQTQSSVSAYVIIEIPLLVESNLQKSVSRILVVDIDPTLQIQRIMQRDKCSQEQAKQIINAQINPDIKLQFAHDIMHNDSIKLKLKRQVALLHAKYMQLSQGSNTTNYGLSLH